MIKANKLFFTVLVSAALAACGGGGDSTPVTTAVAANLPPVAVTAATSAAVVNQPFTFATGVPVFGTTAPTTIAFTSTGATPTFAVSSGGRTASGTTTFGSCIFLVTVSDYPADSPLALGKEVRVNPCNLKVPTAGANANGGASNSEVKFVLGTLESNGVNLPVVINANGSVALNTITIGTVTIQLVTGT